ncbi:recombinase family protein [Gluconobacter sphaericus]|uniref:recombinase family protein n=1 Tax=Gluconobacter sphaericus TaxID=574987 RepID=UPI001B8AD6AB|nr:recombinase family protein [Gluconobacter sphaericus]MBS1098657.1 recombinase family protein [Gluconobacter sphaericus]
MIFGYARTSTHDQQYGLQSQIDELKEQGCERVYSEQVSGTQRDRQELTKLLDNLRPDDVLYVTRPDRLARNTQHLLEIIELLEQKGCSLVILSMGGSQLDTRNATSKLMLTMLGAIAEFERALMKERQQEGIAKAKEQGKYRGRKPTAMAQSQDIKKMKSDGISVTDIAKKLNISRMSVYRALDA